jgi:hypothetical protein
VKTILLEVIHHEGSTKVKVPVSVRVIVAVTEPVVDEEGL